jgi:uncharacterized protein (DUF1501 family)
MKRRKFLAAASSMLLPLTVNGFGITALSKNSQLVQQLLKTAAADSEKILVIIYLNGGNDGLNTVIPLEYYSQYNALRNNIAIPENKVIPLENNIGTGFHPAMTGMAQMYNEGKLGIVHSVSYPNPSLSHVRSTEIWMTGSDSDKYVNTGWAGRYLNSRFPGFPDNYPNDQMQDPLAIQIGAFNSPTLAGPQQAMGMSIENASNFYDLIGNLDSAGMGHLPCCDAGDLIKYMRQQQLLSSSYMGSVTKAAQLGKNFASYPTPKTTNDLSEQLKIVARLIHGGLQSKIYFVEMFGFDTHAAQVGTSSTEGIHAQLLKQLSEGITAFQNDLKLQNTEDKVIGMTFSEFGRRATSNASKGTDHGLAAPMFVFGTGIKKQIIGTNPDLLNDLEPPGPYQGAGANYDIKMQIDFRRIYADILNDWFGNNRATTDTTLFKNFNTTSLFSDVIHTVSSGVWQDRSIWSAGRAPDMNDYVHINSGHTIDLGRNITVRNVQIAGGAELRLLGNYRINTTG